MVLNLRPKCANPSCAASFEWLGGGRIFRFPRDLSQPGINGAAAGKATGKHPLGHFWLCERCSAIYTLHYTPDRGVVILPLWPELPAAASSMHLPAA